jgi:hypothetical protein
MSKVSFGPIPESSSVVAIGKLQRRVKLLSSLSPDTYFLWK